MPGATHTLRIKFILHDEESEAQGRPDVRTRDMLTIMRLAAACLPILTEVGQGVIWRHLPVTNRQDKHDELVAQGI